MEGNETLRGERESAVLSFTPLFLAPPFCSTAVNTHFYQPPRPATFGLLVRAGLITMIKVWWGTVVILFPGQTASHQRFFLVHLVGILVTKDYDQKISLLRFFFFCEYPRSLAAAPLMQYAYFFMRNSSFPSKECSIWPQQVQA